MSCQLTAVTFDAHDPARVAAFWAGLLDRVAAEDRRGVLLPGAGHEVGLRFIGSAEAKAGRDPVHLHLTSTTPDDQRRTVDKALRLGASHLDVGQLPEEGHVVLADPEGNELCVIEPGEPFLAGCGFLGEVTCTGTRDVGFFWAEALGWPLVWDQGPQTAIQSPAGGTKVSWDGPVATHRRGRNRQRFDLTVLDADLDDEADRLVALGATRLTAADDGVVALVDPDGNEFSLVTAP
ncbi:VOC family protein [Cellulomonas composti]|uniref:Glyoxalase-like domain-containing protein n=1 Tax=Cellulomonas composti TaxID=266130 RepID=A0A511J7V0_9CELL|nr:VOC family protein [Cellulomonas composti]GEL94071.1 hypothetical protein CCO02nite_07290 [Cellulomonas composti]